MLGCGSYMVVLAFALRLFSYCLVIYCGDTVRCFGWMLECCLVVMICLFI